MRGCRRWRRPSSRWRCPACLAQAAHCSSTPMAASTRAGRVARRPLGQCTPGRGHGHPRPSLSLSAASDPHRVRHRRMCESSHRGARVGGNASGARSVRDDSRHGRSRRGAGLRRQWIGGYADAPSTRRRIRTKISVGCEGAVVSASRRGVRHFRQMPPPWRMSRLARPRRHSDERETCGVQGSGSWVGGPSFRRPVQGPRIGSTLD